MLIKNLLLILAGAAGGFSIAGGVFAFIVMIGVLPRLAGRTHTGWAYWWYCWWNYRKYYICFFCIYSDWICGYCYFWDFCWDVCRMFFYGIGGSLKCITDFFKKNSFKARHVFHYCIIGNWKSVGNMVSVMFSDLAEYEIESEG